MIQIDSILTLAKSMATKVTKDDSGVPVTVCVLKFSDLEVKDRDIVDEFLGMDRGWCRSTLYDEQGAPRKRFGLQVYGREHRVSGTIGGPKQGQVLSLLQAELTDTQMRLIPLGALIAGTLTWSARGDEVEDVSEILGLLCSARWEVHEGGQGDLFSPTAEGAGQATKATREILDELARRRSSGGPATPGAAST